MKYVKLPKNLKWQLDTYPHQMRINNWAILKIYLMLRYDKLKTVDTLTKSLAYRSYITTWFNNVSKNANIIEIYHVFQDARNAYINKIDELRAENPLNTIRQMDEDEQFRLFFLG